MKTERIVKIALFLAFAAAISAPALFSLCGFRESGPHPEKRTPKARPPLPQDFPSLPRFTGEYQAYFNDSFGLRRLLIRSNNLLRLGLFGESPVDLVAVGKNGWLYYAGEWTMLDYENVMPCTRKDLDVMETNLEQRRRWLADRGIGFYVVVAPNTQTIYPEHLPDHIRKIGEESRYDKIAARMRENPGIEFIDLRNTLLQAKNGRRLYHRTDSHWNDYGAFIGYRELIERIAMRHPGVRRLRAEDFTVKEAEGKGGDLAEMLSLSDLIREERITLTPRFERRSRPATRDYPDPVHYPERDMVVMETGDPSLPRALVFRDSYCSALIPYLSESFRSVVCLWTFEFLPEIVEREKPDVVIFECVERYIHSMTIANPERVRAAVPGPESAVR